MRDPAPHSFFFFNDTATTEIYTLSLHDALPIFDRSSKHSRGCVLSLNKSLPRSVHWPPLRRSEEHTSELQSPDHLVCRLLLEKKKQQAQHRHQRPKITRRQRPAGFGEEALQVPR